jgi:glycosyltransferase involved in cell wall biosynthesis
MPDIESWIKSYVEEHELQNVTLLGHVDDIDTLLQRIDVNLAPVRLNAPPRSVFEAAAFEIPTILALTDIVEDLVEHNKTGLIIPPRNPEAIARAILTLRSDDTARVQMGERAREKLVRQHDPKKGADCVMNIYRSVLKQPSERRPPVVTAS